MEEINTQQNYILLLKSEQISKEQQEKLKQLNYQSINLKLMDFSYKEYENDIMNSINSEQQYDYVCFNSVNSIKSIENCILNNQEQNIIQNLAKIFMQSNILCVGQKTVDYLQKFLDKKSILNLNGSDIKQYKDLENLSRYLKQDEQLQNKKVLYFIGNLTNLWEQFEQNNSSYIQAVVVYKQVQLQNEILYKQLQEQQDKWMNVNAMVFYSKSNVEKFFEFVQFLQQQQEQNIQDLVKKIHNCRFYIGFGKQTTKGLVKQLGEENQNIHNCDNSKFEDILQILQKYS